MKTILSVPILLALPGVVHACAVCGAAVDRNRSAFLGTTILLSLLPLALIGAGLWWVGRRAGGHPSGELTERDVRAEAPGRPAGGPQR